MVKKTIYLKVQIYIFSFQKNYQCEIKLQTKIQIPQQHNLSKLKKYNNVTSKEDRQENKLNKNCSKFTSKTVIKSQCLYYRLLTMFGHVICLKFKNIQYIQRYKIE